MRRVLTCMTLMILGLMWGLPAMGAQTVTLSADAYKAIMERLDSLQRRVEQLEKRREDISQIKNDVYDLYDTMDRVETKTIKDKMNIGAELRTRVDYFYLRDHLVRGNPFDPSTWSKEDLHNDNHWSNRFRVNMDAKLTKDLLFHARLAAYKDWGTIEPVMGVNDGNPAHVPGDSTVKFDRVYVDWILPTPIPMAFTFGRHPSTEGPPQEFKENRLRQATYPSLLFDAEQNGLVFTIGLERYIGWKNAGLRFGYGKGYQSKDSMAWYLDRPDLDDTTFAAAFFESEIPGLPDSLMVLSYIHGDDVNDGMAMANIADVDLFGVHVQAPNILGTGIDAFFSWGLDRFDPNGYVPAIDPSSGQAMAMPTPQGNVPLYVGILSGPAPAGDPSLLRNRTGWAIYTGLRYTLPLPMLKNPKIGFEYNYGSKNWFSFTMGAVERYNKLATRGNVYDLYYIQPVNRFLFLRTGFTFIDYNNAYSGWHIYKPEKVDEKLTDFYILIDCRF